MRWSGAERTGYRSSPAVARSFCARCGSPLAYEHDRSPDEIDLYLGAFDEPGAFPAGKHIHVGERVAWFDTVDQTPRHLKGSDGSEAPVAGGGRSRGSRWVRCRLRPPRSRRPTVLLLEARPKSGRVKLDPGPGLRS